MEEFVKSFEEACAKLGISTQLPYVWSFPENLQKHVTATYKLSKILEANNGDWKPNLADTDQWKYYPWFRIVKDDSQSGCGLSYLGCSYGNSSTGIGVRLACKDEELAEFMGKTFADLYKDLFI